MYELPNWYEIGLAAVQKRYDKFSPRDESMQIFGEYTENFSCSWPLLKKYVSTRYTSGMQREKGVTKHTSGKKV